MRVVTGDNGQVNGLVTENAIPLHPELQSARCMSNRYRPDLFPRCVSCTRRWAGDTCRFQGIRFFIKDKKRDIVGISFVGGRYQDAPKMFYPLKWNVPLKEPHIKRMKLSIAKALLPILRNEYEHIHLTELIRRPRESEVRATCGQCSEKLVLFTQNLSHLSPQSRYMHDFLILLYMDVQVVRTGSLCRVFRSSQGTYHRQTRCKPSRNRCTPAKERQACSLQSLLFELHEKD